MRKFFTLLIWFGLFLPLALSAMMMSSMRSWILDRGFYEGVVNNDHVYAALLNGELPAQFNRQVFGAANQLPLVALNRALHAVITLDYLRTQSGYMVNEMFDFIQGREAEIDVSIDLKPIKAALTGTEGQRFANTLAVALPFCERNQPSIAPRGRLPRCISNAMSIAATATQIAHALPTALENTPDRIVLSNPLNLQQALPTLDGFLDATVRSGLDLAIVMMILLTILVGVVLSYMRGSDLYENLHWLSKSLLVPVGLFLLVGVILANPLMALTPWAGIQASDTFGQALGNMSVLIVQRAGCGLLLTDALTGVIALVLFIFLWKSSTQERTAMARVQIQNH